MPVFTKFTSFPFKILLLFNSYISSKSLIFFVFLRNNEQAWRLELQIVPTPKLPEKGLLPTMCSSFGLTGPDVRPAAPAASSVEHLRIMTPPVAATLMLRRRGLEDMGLAAAAAVAAAALDGNLVTGFAPGQDATNTTLLAGRNASVAMHQGSQVTSVHTKRQSRYKDSNDMKPKCCSYLIFPVTSFR
ncbi:Hypothetical predicted protein [Olea europaea subsp. europaea]|uniref:Uncharacterized protein n=1 Tax=Olea europaea subsp. europaea TaxID=158383 RepID=A0A8S0V044_OLEEU|nr:Hypothetical predicted protein [Olea europaea subsp. europaea]